MRTDRSFERFQREELASPLAALEEQRRAVWRRAVTVGAVLAAAAAAALAWIGPDLISLPPPFTRVTPLVAASVVFPVAAAIVAAFGKPAYAAAYKAQIITAVVRFVDENLRYHPDRGISEAVFEAAGLFSRSAERYHCEDLVEGRVGATEIAFSEVHAQYSTKTRKGSRRWHTIFRGVLFVADFHKHFSGWTVVRPDVAQRLLGRFGQTLQNLSAPSGSDLVKLEDPDFERRFCVYSTNQIEARYILSPSLMRRILDVAERLDGPLSVAFHDSRVFVALSHGRDLLVPPLLRSASDPSRLREYYEDVRQTVALVEELDLNTRIWSKS